MNAAFMAKLRWDLEINKQKPWVIFFSKKYKHLNNPSCNRNSSFIYKSIFKDKQIFTLNTSCLVRNGNDINLWKDYWINKISLQNQLIGPVSLHEAEKKVSSLINYNLQR